MWTEITRPKYERDLLRYASDLTDGEWKVLEPLLPRAKALGRPRTTALREVVNAILPTASSMAHAAPGLPATLDGAALRSLAGRRHLGRSTGNCWSRRAPRARGRPVGRYHRRQSVKTRKAAVSGASTPERKSRAASVTSSPTPAALVAVVVHGAEIQDRDGAPAVFAAIATFPAAPRLRPIGPKLEGALKRIGRWSLEIVNRPAGVKGFQLRRRRAHALAQSKPAAGQGLRDGETAGFEHPAWIHAPPRKSPPIHFESDS